MTSVEVLYSIMLMSCLGDKDNSFIAASQLSYLASKYLRLPPVVSITKDLWTFVSKTIHLIGAGICMRISWQFVA